MTPLLQGFAALRLQSHRAFPSPRMPSAWRRLLAAAACAMLCTAHCSNGAAAPLSSAAHTALDAHSARSIDGYAAFIECASAQFNLPSSWIRAVITVESRGDALAVSPKGAMGLMQLMPTTWATLKDRYHLGANPFDPHDNIVAGTAYLRELLDRFGSSGFLAAYNAGPRRLQRHLTAAQPLPGETARYLGALSRLLPELKIGDAASVISSAFDWHVASLFVVSPPTPSPATPLTGNGAANGPSTAESFALSPQSDGLFVRITKIDSP